MQELLLKTAIVIVTKLLTETFMSKALIAILDSWAKTTENELDNKVVKAMADALGVSVEQMPKP